MERKRKLLFNVIFALALSRCITAGADSTFSTDVELSDRWNLGVSSSIVMPRESALKNGVQIQGLLSYDLYSFLALGVETGWTGAIKAEQEGIDLGTLNSWSILGDIIVKLPIKTGDFLFVPYVVNGFGGIVPDFDEGDTLSNAGLSIEYDPAFIYKLGGGLDFYITEMLGLTFEISYQWADIRGTGEWNGTKIASGSDKIDALYIGVGLKLKF
ncbi:MAG: hypothetical protein ABH883_09365 [Candidatus Omnitrophota bacterium]